ncbi:hypothetical protein, partial [Phocaeicola abscessus]|uniref:hypothetical protein n=1 Tax=Phocaeicola abscessus TaxID=555313 RepID=UPI0028EA8D82
EPVRRRSGSRRIRWGTCPLTFRIPSDTWDNPSSTFRTSPDTLGNLSVDVPDPVGYVGEPVRRRSGSRRIRWGTCPLTFRIPSDTWDNPSSTFRTSPDTLGNLKFDVRDVSG